jgi:hypothetical protein
MMAKRLLRNANIENLNVPSGKELSFRRWQFTKNNSCQKASASTQIILTRLEIQDEIECKPHRNGVERRTPTHQQMDFR